MAVLLNRSGVRLVAVLACCVGVLTALPMQIAEAGTLRAVAGASVLTGEACPSTSADTCLSVGDQALTNERTIGVVALPNGRVRSVPGTGNLTAVSCATTTQCIALGTTPAIRGTTTNVIVPILAAGIGPVESVPSNLDLQAISCADSSCLAVGDYAQ